MNLNFLAGLCIVTMLLVGASVGLGQDKSFIYDAHGKRDPFLPLVLSSGEVISYETDLEISHMALQGILADPQGNSLAVINGKVVKPGDHVGAYEVELIEAGQVQLRKDQEQFSLQLKKGGT